MSASSIPKTSGKKLLAVLVTVVVVLVVAAFLPPVRHRIAGWYDDIFSKPHPVALAGTPVGVGYGACPPPVLGSDNSTLYWYTRPVRDGHQSVTVRVAHSFTGTVSAIVFTPFAKPATNPTTTLTGPAPHPAIVQLTSRPRTPPEILRLSNPPVLQRIAVSVEKPTTLTLTLRTTDAGAVRTSCAETGIVFQTKS